MTVQVIEAVSGVVATTAGSPNTASVTLTTTPLAGDKVIVVATTPSNPTVQSVAGLGGTFSLVTSKKLVGSMGSAIYLGTGATSSGAVTVTMNFSVTIHIQVLLVRGLGAGITTFATDYNLTGGGAGVTKTLAPAITLQPDTFVLGISQQQAGTVGPTWPSSSSSPGWTTSGPTQITGNSCYIGVAWQVTTALYTPTLGITCGNGNYIDDQLLFFGAPVGDQVEASYVEALTDGTPATVLEGAYVEALTQAVAPIQVESTYTEVITPVRETGGMLGFTVGLSSATKWGAEFYSKALWLRGKDLGTSGSTVTTWADQSGNGNDVTTSTTTVAAAATPSGGKAGRLLASYITLSDLGLIVRAVSPSASGMYNSDPQYAPGKLNDGNASTEWVGAASTSTGWVTYRLTGGAQAISQYTIRASNPWNDGAPRDWTFQGSNDNASWTTLETRTGVTFGAGQSQTFSITGAVAAYLYYRLNITANNGRSEIRFAEWNLTGVSTAATHGDGEMWLVVKSNTDGASAWSFGTSGLSSHFTYGGAIYEDFGSTSRNSASGTGVFGNWRLYRVNVDSGTGTAYQTIWVDGVQKYTSVATKSWSEVPKLANGWSGDIAEVVIRTQASNATQVADFISYFNTEHGLSVPGGSFTATGTAGFTVGATSSASTVTLGLPVNDNFNRADTTLAQGLGQTSDGKYTWTVDTPGTGGFTVSSNRMMGNQTGSSAAVVKVDPGVSSYVAQATLAVIVGKDTALAVRVQDRSNHFLAYGGAGAPGGGWCIAKGSAGSYTFPVTSAVAPTAGDVVKLVVTPTTIQLVVNGVSLGTVTDSTFASSTAAGFWQGSSTAAFYDDFSLTAPTAPTATGAVGFTASLSSTESSTPTATGTLPLTSTLSSAETTTVTPVKTGQLPLTIGVTSAEVNLVPPTGLLPLTVGATTSASGTATGAAALTTSLSASPMGVATALLPGTAGASGAAVGTTSGVLGMSLSFSLRDQGVVDSAVAFTLGAADVAAGTATSTAYTDLAGSVAVAGATDSTVGLWVSASNSTITIDARLNSYLTGTGTLTGKLALIRAVTLSGEGSLSSSTAFRAVLNSVLGGTGTLTCGTASVVPMAVELTAFGTLRSHPQGTTRDNIDVWFAGPVTESREVTGPAAGVGTGQGPYLENDYNFSGPED